MVFEHFIGLINIIQMNSYFFIFLLIVIEGPIVTAVASYAASLGYFNIWIIFLLSILGNLIADVFFYIIGRFSRTKRTEGLIKKFGLKDCQIKSLEENLKKHVIKTLFIIKLTPLLPIPGLLVAGFSKIPFKKFLFYDLFLILISTSAIILLGYYFGFAINSIFKYFKIGQFSILGVIIVLFLLYIFYKKLKQKERIRC